MTVPSGGGRPGARPPGGHAAVDPLRHERVLGRLRFALSGGRDLAPTAPGADAARALVAGRLGVAVDRFLLPRQVHSDRVLAVDGAWDGDAPEADGLLVRRPGTAVGVLAADCMPLLLGDPAVGVAAAVHVGRAGLHLGIAGVAVAALAAAGATSLVAVVGPTVCGRCYEVPEEMRDRLASVVPAAAATTRAGTPSVDIPAGVRSQLAAASARTAVPVQVDEAWSTCTVEDPDSFSHRRDAPTGRHAAVVVVTDP